MASYSFPSLSIEVHCKSRVSEIGVPVPRHRTAFSVTFEIHHRVRLTRIYSDSGVTITTKTHAVKVATAEYLSTIVFSDGTSGISHTLMELEVQLLIHQQIIDQIRRAAVHILIGDVYSPRHALYPMTVKIDRLTYRAVILRVGEEIDPEEANERDKPIGEEQEEPLVVESALNSDGDKADPNIGGGGEVAAKLAALQSEVH
ncbi:hypothetical protein SAY87_004689 [Trapa incisa]|uniref:Uncharacterized protein n=1 Tax=Trapa incisa TaxID=236973 RepID=A0AAN7JQ24_9MYRT|nr:hypothetical protein SAY87_004689 [Trapa incisa]